LVAINGRRRRPFNGRSSRGDTSGTRPGCRGTRDNSGGVRDPRRSTWSDPSSVDHSSSAHNSGGPRNDSRRATKISRTTKDSRPTWGCENLSTLTRSVLDRVTEWVGQTRDTAAAEEALNIHGVFEEEGWAATALAGCVVVDVGLVALLLVAGCDTDIWVAACHYLRGMRLECEWKEKRIFF
jgi:hypothetical protein